MQGLGVYSFCSGSFCSGVVAFRLVGLFRVCFGAASGAVWHQGFGPKLNGPCPCKRIRASA